MSASEKKADELMERVLLEIKAMVLLQGSDTELKSRLRTRLVESHDESLRRFVKALQGGRRRETGRLVVVALGELALASVLVLMGAVILLPAVAGIDTPAGLAKYFAEEVYGAIATSPLAQYVPLMQFVLGAVLMLSAFYTLRQAALSLKDAGLAIEPGES